MKRNPGWIIVGLLLALAFHMGKSEAADSRIIHYSSMKEPVCEPLVGSRYRSRVSDTVYMQVFRCEEG